MPRVFLTVLNIKEYWIRFPPNAKELAIRCGNYSGDPYMRCYTAVLFVLLYHSSAANDANAYTHVLAYLGVAS